MVSNTQSIECLIRLAHCCQSVWTGQVFGLSMSPEAWRRPCSSGIQHKDTFGRQAAFLWAYSDRSGSLLLQKESSSPSWKMSDSAPAPNLGPFPCQIVHTREDASKKPQERATFAKYQPASKASLLSSPSSLPAPPQKKTPTNKATTLSHLLSLGFFIVREIMKSTELFPFPTPHLWASVSPPVKWEGLFWLVRFEGGLNNVTCRMTCLRSE